MPGGASRADDMGILILLAAGALLCILGGTAGLYHTMLHPQRRTFAFALARRMPADPADLQLAAESARFGMQDGTVSPGWLIDGGRPDGPVIVVTHGWSSSRYMALGKAAALRPLASRIVLYDLRGHGDATGSICRLGSTEVADLECVLSQLPPTDRPVVLLGSSLGAGVSIVAAARDAGRRVTGVIAEGPYRHFAQPIAGYLRCRGYPPFPFASLASLTVAVMLGGFRGFDRAAHAARLRCPLLVLHGRHDPVCPIAAGRQIAAAAPDGAIVEFNAGGHGGLAAVDPERYLGALASFLERVSADATGGPGVPAALERIPDPPGDAH